MHNIIVNENHEIGIETEARAYWAADYNEMPEDIKAAYDELIKELGEELQSLEREINFRAYSKQIIMEQQESYKRRARIAESFNRTAEAEDFREKAASFQSELEAANRSLEKYEARRDEAFITYNETTEALSRLTK